MILVKYHLSLIAVIVALIIGVTSIVQSQKLQHKALIHLLLNDVIDWAKNVSAQAEERERGVNLPAWYERWAILRAEKIGIVDKASRIDKDLKQAVEEGVRKFELMDGAVTGTTSGTFINRNCSDSCKRILEVAQNCKAKNLRSIT